VFTNRGTAVELTRSTLSIAIEAATQSFAMVVEIERRQLPLLVLIIGVGLQEAVSISQSFRIFGPSWKA
jgi:hypothetical protein